MAGLKKIVRPLNKIKNEYLQWLKDINSQVIQQAIQKTKDFDSQDADDEAEEKSNLQLSSYLNVKEAVYCSRRRSTLYFV